jgi:ribosomal protein S18 acetylase RimI-like enzyme
MSPPVKASAPPVIRRARPSEADLVLQLSAAAYVPAYAAVIGAVPKPATEDYGPRIEHGDVWLLEAGQDVAGVAAFERQAGFLLIYSIAVVPEHQHKGYGRALLAFAEKRAIELGLREVRLYTNQRMTANLQLYRAAGYAEVGTRPHPSRAGETLVDLSKGVTN